MPFVIPAAPLDDIRKYVDSMLWSEEEKALVLEKKANAQSADGKCQPVYV